MLIKYVFKIAVHNLYSQKFLGTLSLSWLLIYANLMWKYSHNYTENIMNSNLDNIIVNYQL